MTKEQAIEKLKQLQSMEDPERDHLKADGVLCEFLSALGYSDVVAEFEKVPKWHA